MNGSSNGVGFIRRVNSSVCDFLLKLDLEDGAFWCECDDLSCDRRVVLTLREYAALRDRGDDPLLARSHAPRQGAPVTGAAHV